MPTVKVWNDNIHDHRESFKGTDMVIPSKSYVEMEYEEAVEFKGQYTPMPPAEFNGDIAKFYKMIRVESPPPDARLGDDPLVCHANGRVAANQNELMAMISEFASLRVKDPEAEKEARSKTDSTREEIAALKAQVAELAALVEAKRGPGRPPKEASK